MNKGEHYIRRKIDVFLEDWKKNPDRLPVIVKGARQVGKTESILRFARKKYRNTVYINFVVDAKYKAITKDGYSPDSIRKNISLINLAAEFVPGKTIIIFDELQEFPEIASCLKFFCLEKKYDVVCSGSLLGINYQKIESNSVGYKTDYAMSSLDFEEFLWAKGYTQSVIDGFLEKMNTGQPFGDAELEIFSGIFRDYCITGGMPAIVSRHIRQNSFEGLLDMQRQLMLDYREDVRKYASGIEKTRILHVLEHIPVQLAKENKKFQISKISSGARFKDYWGCIEWLKDAGIVNICYCLNFPELPLKGNYDPSKYKLYYFDTGMLIASLDEESQEDLRANSNFGVYKGALYENILAESLTKQGYGLYYYKKQDSTLEQDFFVRSRKNLIPVEAKATGGRAKSLRTLIDSVHYPDIEYGIKFTSGNIGFANNVCTFPYFCSFLLKRHLKNR